MRVKSDMASPPWRLPASTSASAGGYSANPIREGVAASKGGVMLLMKSVAQEVAALGIRVNSISPGAIKTPINKDAWSTPEALAELMRLIPYKRIGEPEDVGRAAVFLSSDDSDYITGTSLVVDGGMTLYPGFESGG
jgi:glucose 1-dehydrogenase